LSGSTILFVSRMSTPTGRNTSLFFTNADDNPFWMVGLIAGITFRLLSRVSRRAAVLGITLIVLCATIWYNVANRQSPAISPAPSVGRTGPWCQSLHQLLRSHSRQVLRRSVSPRRKIPFPLPLLIPNKALQQHRMQKVPRKAKGKLNWPPHQDLRYQHL
jgi:hypothetical protein